MKKFNYRRLSDIPYTPESLAEALSANPRTIYQMIHNENLPTIGDGKNPYIINGVVASKFLKKRAGKNKCPLKHADEFYCFKCKANRMADSSQITIKNNEKFGICSVCDSEMRKYF